MGEHEQRLEDLRDIVDVLNDLYPDDEVSAMMVEPIEPEKPEK